jgi:putative acetyltransferase
VLIRQEIPNDHAAVADLQQLAFGDGAPDAAAYVADLRALLDARLGLSLVAIDENEVIGHALFTSNLLDTPKQLMEVQVLSPIGVMPERQGHGVGGALIRSGLDNLAKLGVPMVVLEGSPTYYSRFGFTSGRQLGLRRPSLRIPDAAFQAKTLPTYRPWMTGTLVYREVFWDHDAVGLRETSPPVSCESP